MITNLFKFLIFRLFRFKFHESIFHDNDLIAFVLQCISKAQSTESAKRSLVRNSLRKNSCPVEVETQMAVKNIKIQIKMVK